MKKLHKIIIGIFVLTALISIINLNTVAATDVQISGSDVYEDQVQANIRNTYQFRERTQIAINSTVNIDLKIECDALRIGVKYFELEIEADSDLAMNMTCNEEQAELGLLLGNRYTVRNQHRYTYREGFCVSLDCNGSFTQARLKIQLTTQNRNGEWAYYGESKSEWITVPTTIEDGYLVTETDHFSTWTILIPETNYWPYIVGIFGAVVGIVAAISIVGMIYHLKKRI